MKIIYSPRIRTMEEFATIEKAEKRNSLKRRVLELGLFLICAILTSSLYAQTTSALVLTSQTADISAVTKTGTTYDQGVATTSWTVNKESKFCVYVLEKSHNNEDFIPVAKFIRRENENREEYTWVDSKPWAGPAYYRLLVVYKNGAYDYAPAGAINEEVLESVDAGTAPTGSK